MKLNNENYDQSSFPYHRVLFSLLWLRKMRFTPDALRVSYRDMVVVMIEHRYPDLMINARKWLQKISLKRFKKEL